MPERDLRTHLRSCSQRLTELVGLQRLFLKYQKDLPFPWQLMYIINCELAQVSSAVVLYLELLKMLDREDTRDKVKESLEKLESK